MEEKLENKEGQQKNNPSKKAKIMGYGAIFVILAILFWLWGDRINNYNGFLVFLGWAFLALAVYYFTREENVARDVEKFFTRFSKAIGSIILIIVGIIIIFSVGSWLIGLGAIGLIIVLLVLILLK